MHVLIRYLAVLVSIALLAGPLHAQESSDAGEEPAASDDEGRTPAADDDVAADAPVDDTSYIDIEEEDFRPSEEIPADQSIAFPTDI